MSRRKIHELRSAMYDALQTLPKSDRSPMAERERDLVGETNCAIWDRRVYKISACLRRLMGIPERGIKYQHVWELLEI